MNILFSLVVLFVALFVVLVPLGLMAASAVINLRDDGERFARWRAAAMGGEGKGFWARSFIGALNACASTGVVGATYALGLLPRRQGRGEGPPVLLVHGLYHNPSAWLGFRRVLRREGFGNLYDFGYGSFSSTFADLVHGLTVRMERVLAENPGARLTLVGHSLGGLVIRAAMADGRFAGRVGAVATLGTPHQGSLLARLGIGRLARSLHPEDPLFERLATQEPVRGVPCLSLFTPLDNMVFPVRGLELPEGETAGEESAWTQEPLPPLFSHVGMVYDRGVALRVADHLREADAAGLLRE
ncbi:MAG: esterase/lipase family protein [Desulfovibrionaceae bacterium]